MSFYQQRVLPRLIHAGMGRARLAPLRAELVAGAEGRVLEVGVGSGLNLPHYRRQVVQVIGIDASRPLLARAQRSAPWTLCPTWLVEGRAEALPIASASVDQVIMTWTLCSIADPIGALGEVRRVLRPGGALLFIEHGQAPDDQPRVQRWQHRLTPSWRRLAGNCHLNRRIDRLLIAAGLRPTHLEQGYLVGGPKILSFHYRGRAVPA